MFRFDAPQYNNRNVGAVIRRSADIRTYDDLLADVVLHADIPMDCATVGQYLCDHGYVGKMPIDKQLNAIIALTRK